LQVISSIRLQILWLIDLLPLAGSIDRITEGSQHAWWLTARTCIYRHGSCTVSSKQGVLEMMHGCIYAALLSCWDLGGPGLDWIDIQETLVEIYILVM